MKFLHPEYLLLLLLLIPYIIWYVLKHKEQQPSMKMADMNMFRTMPVGYKNHLLHVPFILRLVTLSMCVVILARPQTSNSWEKTFVEGIDIMLAVDVSTSMLAEDLTPNRLEAAKQVAAEFIASRPNDNIGLTIFAGESYTQCPMTTDHAVLLNLFKSIRCDIAQRGLIKDGTAVGMGIANAVSRLKDSKAKSKVIILLTDGTNNSGEIAPVAAAQMAKTFGIRIYTIGVGTNDEAPYPMPVAGGIQRIKIPVEIDTKTLTEIAEETDGEFYRATNNTDLARVYKEIDKLEKTKFDVKKYSKKYEAYYVFALVAVIALLLEVFLRVTILKRIP